MRPAQRKLYINLALLAGVLLLASLLWLSPTPRGPELKPFAHIHADTLNRIEIIVPQQQPALLQRQDGNWHALGRPAETLDPQRLQNVLNILNESVEREYETAGLDLKEFGLDPPAAELKLDDHTLRFGASEPLSGRRYVLYEDKLYLLTDTHYPLLSRGINNLLKTPHASGNTDAPGIE